MVKLEQMFNSPLSSYRKCQGAALAVVDSNAKGQLILREEFGSSMYVSSGRNHGHTLLTLMANEAHNHQ